MKEREVKKKGGRRLIGLEQKVERERQKSEGEKKGRKEGTREIDRRMKDLIFAFLIIPVQRS